MKKLFLLACSLLALSACTTAQLQTAAANSAAINTIICATDAKAQPILVPLVSTVAVVTDPGAAPAVAGAVALDNTLHAALQAACPAGTMLLGGLATTAAAPAAPQAPTVAN